MNKKYRFVIGLLCLSAVFACSQIEETVDENPIETAKVEMNFTATIEQDSNPSKTTLDGSLSDATLRTLWSPRDEIGIIRLNDSNGQVESFVNTYDEESEVGVFNGTVPFGDEYAAIYPYSNVYGNKIDDSNCGFIVEIPTIQEYVPGSFAQNVAPMVAKARYGEELEFKNLCGLFALNLIGDEVIESIKFSARDEIGNLMKIAGDFFVPMNRSDYTSLMPTPNDGPWVGYYDHYTSITLNCNEPVQLSRTVPTPFFFVLPPATYHSIELMITTVDGKVMYKTSKAPLVIERAHAKPTAALEFIETGAVDLSEDGFANCYMVERAGLYSFNASVIGNGYNGLISDVGFHTTDTSIEPYYVELVWEDRENVIDGLSLSDGRVKFRATGTFGNALIAVKDASGIIIWSWHIWVTENPSNHVYNTSEGKRFVVMDRNLGSVSSEVGADGGALYYQWGRKDPFFYGADGLNGMPGGDFTDLGQVISYPSALGWDLYSNDWLQNLSVSLWSSSKKTIYDPCPLGWKVPTSEIWSGIYKLYDHDGGPYGVIFGFSVDDSFWYPDTPLFNRYGSMDGSFTDDNTELWTAEYGVSYYMSYNTSYRQSRSSSEALPIRCVKE